MTLSCRAESTLPRHGAAAASNACGLTAQTTMSAVRNAGPGRRLRLDAEAADEAPARALARLDDDERGAGTARLDQAADDRLGHVAAADENDVAHRQPVYAGSGQNEGPWPVALVTMRLRGSCHCGAVSFTVEAPSPVPFLHCHCSICRKTAGSGGYAINLGARAATMKVRGEAHLGCYHALIREPGKRARRSPAERRFCKECGSALWLWDPPGPN